VTPSGRLRVHIAGCVALLCAVAVALLGDLSAHVPAMLAGLALGFAPVGAMALMATSGRSLLPGRRRQVVLLVLAWALLLRLPALFLTEPTLSDDIFRYVWEGRLVALQIDPYDVPPDSPALTRLALDSPEWASINHRELPAIYPPAAQWFFGTVARFSPTPFAMRAAMVAVDLVLVALLGALVVVSRRDPRWLAVYAWHPLVIVEVASSGHYEPLAILPLVGGLLAWRVHRSGASSWLLWGAAVATKYVGGAAAWFAARRLIDEGRWERALFGLFLSGLMALLFALPFALDGRPPIGSLGTYVQHWGHNGSVHALLTSVIGYHPARKVVFVLFGLWALALAWRGPEPAKGFLLLFAGLIVLSPVVHPWYGLWLIALLPLFPSPALLTLSALLPLSYLAWTVQAAGGGWEAPPWVPWLEYGAPLAVGLLSWLARRPSS